MKILCVEDDEASRYWLETLLKSQRHQVMCAADGRSALQALQQEDYDLIISDIMMPQMDGFDLCYQIKTNPFLSKIPFVFYSAAYTQPGDIEFALQLGADSFLVKPLMPENLLAEIHSVTSKAKLNQTARITMDQHEFLLGHAQRIGQKLEFLNQELHKASQKLQQTEYELSDTKKMLGLLVNHSSDAVLIVDRQGRFLSANSNLNALLKRPAPISHLAQLLPAERYSELLAMLAADDKTPLDFHEVIIAGDCRIFITALPIHYQDQPALLIMLRNLGTYQQASNQRRLDQHVLKNLSEGVIITNAENRVIAVNPAFTRITGYSETDVIGKTPRILRSGKQKHGFYRHMWSSLLEDGEWQGELWNRRKNGELFPEWLFLSLIRDENNKILFHIGIFNDISVHEEARRHIEHLAHYDPLTDTPNRTLLRYRINEAVQAAERSRQQIGLLFIDIDRLKNINESLGYPVGDEVIKAVCQRLQSFSRPGDTVGRHSDDEFLMLLNGIAHRNEITQIADSVINAINEPYLIDGREIYISCSIGIALYPEDGLTEATLVKNAGISLYKAKNEGRNHYLFYSPGMNKAAEDRIAMENALRQAITRNELRLVFQPQYRLRDEILTGCEVLVRWTNPELGEVSPSVFIPIAEESGQIILIGEWILRQACLQVRQWIQTGLPSINFAVNISAVQFGKPSLIAQVREILAETKLHPHLLELELTEGLLMRETQHTLETLRTFKKMGIQLSIDDFGTGYSNLAYLNRFSVDKLKIDQSFVRGLPHSANDLAIVQAIIQMAHNLSLTVIAEGVETEAQKELLTTYDCDIGQGYLFAKPLETHQFEAKLKALCQAKSCAIQ